MGAFKSTKIWSVYAKQDPYMSFTAGCYLKTKDCD